jgi:hypothetical protein
VTLPWGTSTNGTSGMEHKNHGTTGTSWLVDLSRKLLNSGNGYVADDRF